MKPTFLWQRSSLALAAAVVLGVALRLVHVSDPLILDYHAWRQADTAGFTHGYLIDSFQPLDPSLDRYPCEHRDQPFGRVEAELPVSSWLAALPLKLVGVSCPPAPYLRLVSILFFIGGAIYLYLLCLALGGSAALGSASVLAISLLPLAIFFTRTVQPDGPALFFAAAFLTHLSWWVTGGRLRHGVLSGVLGALLFLQKISFAFIFFPAVYLIVSEHGWLGALRRVRYWIWGIALLLPVAAWYWSVHDSPWSFGIWEGSGKYSSFQLLQSAAFWKLLSERLTFEILSWAGVALLLVGLTEVPRSRLARLCAVWLAAIALFILGAIPAHRTHIYYQLPLVQPAAVLIGFALLRAWRQGVWGRAALALLLLIHGLTTARVLEEYYRPDARVGEGVALIERHVPPQSTLVSTDRNPALFSNACVRGWFSTRPGLAHLEGCLGQELRYLLLDARARGALQRNPGEWRRFSARFEQLEAGRHFSLWRRKASSAPAPAANLPLLPRALKGRR